MKRSSVLPRNFFKRPKIKLLVPDLKLLLTVLVVGCESHMGVGIPSGESEDTGLNWDSIKAGKEDLIRRDLIEIDTKTGEIFIKDWFRDNTFKGNSRIYQSRADFKSIESAILKLSVLEAVKNSPECGLTADILKEKPTIVINQQLGNQAKAIAEVEVEVEELQSAAAKLSEKNDLDIKNQTHCSAAIPTTTQNQPNDEFAEFEELIEAGVKAPTSERDPDVLREIKAFTAEQIKVAVHALIPTGKQPFPTNVLVQLNAKHKPARTQDKTAKGKKFNAPPKFDPQSVKDSIDEYANSGNYSRNMEFI